MRWRYTLTLSLSLDFIPSLSNIFLLTCGTDYDIYKVKTSAWEAVFQFKSNLNVFKGVVIKRWLQYSHLLSLQLYVPDKTSPNSALVKSFLRLED